MKIGEYHLDQPLDNEKFGLQEFTSLDYKTIPRNFKNERIYHGATISFANYEWGSIVATVNGIIYKVALSSISVSEVAILKILKTLSAEFGALEQEDKGFSYTYHTEWGRINFSKEHDQFLSIIFTSNKPYKELSNMYFVKPYLQRLMNYFNRISSVLLFDKDIDKILLLRALEWARWPLFISQPVAPFLLLYIWWWQLLLGIVVLTWIWSVVRFRYQNLALALFGSFFVKLKWPSSILMGIYFILVKNYYLSLLSFIWPALTMLLVFITPSCDLGRLQQMFRDKLLNEVNSQ